MNIKITYQDVDIITMEFMLSLTNPSKPRTLIIATNI